MYAGCNFLILGGTTINASGDNVRTYDCDGFGTCVLIDSYFDASAPYTPLEPDEEEIELTPENPNSNSNSPEANAGAKSGAALNDFCSGGLGGGGGGSGGVGYVITLRPIHPGVRSEITLRPFYRAYGGSGGPGSGGNTRAMREKPEVKSTSDCVELEDVRSLAARVALDNALGWEAAAAIRQAVVTTKDGYKEIWQRASFSTPYFLINTTCPNPG